jgi:cytochrome b
VASNQELVPVRIWDLPTRLFHWSLVLLVAFSAITGELGEDLPVKFMDWHRLSGYAILTLLLFRLVWGVIGSTHARFTNFVRGPAAALRYVQEALGRAPATRHLGHNPLGGWSVLMLMACLAIQVVTGLFIADEDLGVEGPFAKLVSSRVSDALAEIHEGNFGVLLALIGLHLSAIAFYLVAKGENLVRPMLTGFKRLPPGESAGAAKGGHLLLGVLVLAMAAAAVWLLINKA